jgi:hypothetical protein
VRGDRLLVYHLAQAKNSIAAAVLLDISNAFSNMCFFGVLPLVCFASWMPLL